ncbi:MAG: DUF420 domain-containing protein [Acidobacteriota bacterium]|nr:DUF420 domain-containing protein [Acidobacteriota bacterium]MDH3786122.1 DUF420 domain-containing protein [Acidobacteriota bacterium]
MKRSAFPLGIVLAAVVIVLVVYFVSGSAPTDESLSHRPRLHAILNGTCACLLLLGLFFIRRRRIGAHLTTMLLATGTSVAFLVSYLDYHRHAGATPFQGDGWSRPVYFGILLSHTVLAALVPPLVACLIWFAARKQFDRHRKLARWTLPVWIYVSVTGVLIYYMLYIAFAPN